MSLLSRRSVIVGVPAASLGATGALAATGAAGATALAEPEPTVITFTARRTKATLANVPAVVPALGTTFIACLDLRDGTGTSIGDGSVNGSIVDVILGVPPQLVVQAHVIFRLPDGEIHTSNMHVRTIPNPGVQHLVAITGGTAAYRTARGSGTIEHTTDKDTTVVLNVLVDPPA